MRKSKSDPLPIDLGGNGSRIETMEFDRADALMLAHAMLIAANTAMLNRNDQGKNRLSFYREQFLKLVPAGAHHFRSDEDFAEIAIAMSSHDVWTIHRVHGAYYEKKFQAVVTVGKKSWYAWRVDDAEFAEMIEAIKSIAPFSCQRKDAEDIRQR